MISEAVINRKVMSTDGEATDIWMFVVQWRKKIEAAKIRINKEALFDVVVKGHKATHKKIKAIQSVTMRFFFIGTIDNLYFWLSLMG